MSVSKFVRVQGTAESNMLRSVRITLLYLLNGNGGEDDRFI